MSKTGTLYLNESASASRVGGRAENQDNYGCTNTPFGQLFVVCDGMGGGPGGRTASTTAVNVFIQSVVDADESMSCQDIMVHAAEVANGTLLQLMDEHEELRGMGTTLVAILFNSQAAIVAHVGDSRLYHLRGRKVLFRTADHSMVGEMVRRGTITEEQARLSSQSNIITRALGAGDNHEPEIDIQPFLLGDRFVLCTDGVWGSMPESDLIDAFSRKESLDTLAAEIAAQVDKIGIDKGGRHDNLTLTIIDSLAKSALHSEEPGAATRLKNIIKKIF